MDVTSENIDTSCYYYNPCNNSTRLNEIGTAFGINTPTTTYEDKLSFDSTENAYTVSQSTTSKSMGFPLPLLTNFVDWNNYNRLICSVEIKNKNNNANARAGLYLKTRQWYAVEKEDAEMNYLSFEASYNRCYQNTQKGSTYNIRNDWIKVELILDLYNRYEHGEASYEDNYKLTGTVNIINSNETIVSTWTTETKPFNLNNSLTDVGLVARSNASNQTWFRNLIIKKINI